MTEVIQRHLAPPSEVPADTDKVGKRYDRVDGRAKKLLAWAAANNIRVDTDGLTAAALAAEAALGSGTAQQARQASKAYLAEVEQLEDTLEATR